MALNFQDKYGHQALDAKQHYDHFTGNAIVSGVAPSAGSTGLEVDIASGTAIVNGSETSVSSQTVTLNTADSTNPRKDVITIDSNGNATIYTGTAESRKPEQNATKFDLQRPAPDDLNGVNEAVVAEVFVAEGATTLGSSDVRDRRNIASAFAGSLDMFGDIDMGSNSITSVNQVDGVNVANHSSRHESGGSDEITFGSLSNVDITAALYDTAANLPNAGTQGHIFFETDTGRTLFDNGTSWVEVGLSESQISLANLSSNSHSELTNISSNDHHAKYTDEEAQDAVGGILNADFTYDDAGNSIALASNSLTVANTTIGLGDSGTPEADNLEGNNGSSGQVLQTDGSTASWVSLIDGGGKVFVQDTEPNATEVGDVWIASGGDL